MNKQKKEVEMRNTMEQDKPKKQRKKIVITRQLSQKVNAIMTSGKTTGEILAAIAALHPAFSKDGAAE